MLCSQKNLAYRNPSSLQNVTHWALPRPVELGIPATQQQKSIQWTKAIIKRMGTVTNKELAEEPGVAEATVALHRRRLIGKSR